MKRQRSEDSPFSFGHNLRRSASLAAARSQRWRLKKHGPGDGSLLERVQMWSATAFFVVAIFIFCASIMGAVFASRRRGPVHQGPYNMDPDVDYFSHFEGQQDCGIASLDLYRVPVPPSTARRKNLFCDTRESLLQALSGGGRHGFDLPYTPNGCHYRWYTADEICMILERFDGIFFIGDDMLKHIYAAFNILLRENIGLGGLEQWRMDDQQRKDCRCDSQFTHTDCWQFIVSGSSTVEQHDREGSHSSPYRCQRIPHFFVPISGSPASESAHGILKDLLNKHHDHYNAIPIIHSLGLSTSLSWPTAIASMDEWLGIADASERNTPFLWVGPGAAGHLKPPGKILAEGNNALWHYTREMSREAERKGMETLNMYNMTIQAESWDGSNYGVRVSLAQAMMVMNWLARVEST